MAPAGRLRQRAPGIRAAEAALAALLLAAGAARVLAPLSLDARDLAFVPGSRRRAGASRGQDAALRMLPQRAAGEEAGVRIRLEDLEPGQELNGLVTSVAPFGCFVDVGGDRDGFVHISRIAEGFVDDTANFVEPGQSVKVWVKEVDAEGKLDLSMVKAKAEPGGKSADLTAFSDLPPDEFLEGNVASIVDFGLFVLVPPPGGGPSVQGLVHISQIREGFVEHPAEEAQVGQVVKVRVMSADPEKGRLRLSMKPYAGPKAYTTPDDQDISPFQGFSPSTWVKARVHHTAPFGVFAELEPPSGGEKVMGLVHVTEIREGFVDDTAEEVELGQEIDVRIISVDTSMGRLSLSMKPEAEEAA